MLFSLLTVLFVGLKLTNFIDWSWWLVLLPAYGGLLLAFFAWILCIIGAVLFSR